MKIKFEVGGELQLAGDTKPPSLPMSVVADFDYFERRLDDGSVAADHRSVRYYAGAEAAIKVGQQATSSKLTDEHRLIRIAATGDRATLGAARGFLTREERDLLELPFNSLLLEQLLPPAAAGAKPGTSWKPAETTMAMLLTLDAVSKSDVKATTSALDGEVGEVSIAGTLDGAVGGVATVVEVKGKLHYDTVHQQPFALAVLIKEKRSVGNLAPGLDVVAKLQVQITPVDDAPQLADAALAGIDLAAAYAEPPLSYKSKQSRFSVVYEPRWRITREEHEALAMRLIDRGEPIAQCNISILPKLSAKDSLTLETFQKDVERTLGKSFGQFERAAERQTPAGLRMLHVAAVGEVSELPITWHYYLLIDRDGRRAAISFTFDSALAERFGDAGRLVLDEFRFTKPDGAAADTLPKGASRPRIRLAR